MGAKRISPKRVGRETKKAAFHIGQPYIVKKGKCKGFSYTGLEIFPFSKHY